MWPLSAASTGLPGQRAPPASCSRAPSAAGRRMTAIGRESARAPEEKLHPAGPPACVHGGFVSCGFSAGHRARTASCETVRREHPYRQHSTRVRRRAQTRHSRRRSATHSRWSLGESRTRPSSCRYQRLPWLRPVGLAGSLYTSCDVARRRRGRGAGPALAFAAFGARSGCRCRAGERCTGERRPNLTSGTPRRRAFM